VAAQSFETLLAEKKRYIFILLAEKAGKEIKVQKG
jgi:hypothetical protein